MAYQVHCGGGSLLVSLHWWCSFVFIVAGSSMMKGLDGTIHGTSTWRTNKGGKLKPSRWRTLPSMRWMAWESLIQRRESRKERQSQVMETGKLDKLRNGSGRQEDRLLSDYSLCEYSRIS